MSKIKNKKQALIQRIKIVEKQILELQTILAVVWVDKKNDYKADEEEQLTVIRLYKIFFVYLIN